MNVKPINDWRLYCTGIIITLLGIAALLTSRIMGAPAIPGAPKVNWSIPNVAIKVPAGASVERNISFIPSEDLEAVSVEVVPELQSYVSVSPSALTNLKRGKEVTISLRLKSSATATPETLSGTVHLRDVSGNSKKTIPLPLALSLSVIWTEVKQNEMGISVLYPPSFPVSYNPGQRLQELSLFANQTAFDRGVAPLIVVTIFQLSPGQSIRDRIVSFGVNDATIQETSFGGNNYLSWSEEGGTGMMRSYSMLTPAGGMLTVTVPLSIAGTPLLDAILTSIAFSK